MLEFYHSWNRQILIQKIKKENFTPNKPAWRMNKPKIPFDSHSDKKSETSPIIMKYSFNELKSNYTNYTHFYTDGSNDDMRVDCAVVSDTSQKTCKFQMALQFLLLKQKLLI